jgi:putative endopeptidase
VVALALCACQPRTPSTPQDQPSATAATQPATGTPAIGSWGVDLAKRDETVRPGDDFFRYASGAWLKSYELPDDKTSFGSFRALSERSQERVRGIIDELTATAAPTGSVEQKIGDYYASFMNQATLDARGYAPLTPELAAIAAIEDLEGLARAFGRADLVGTQSPLGVGLEIDRKQPERWWIGVSASGLGMPDRDYYLEDTERFRTLQEAYEAHIETMLGLVGYEDAAAAAAGVMALETAIAEQQWPRSDRRDRDLTYNPSSFAALESSYPGFPWRALFEGAGVVPEELNVRHPSAMGPLIEIIATTELTVWRAYLTYHLLVQNAVYLSAEIDDATFEFYGRALRGQQAPRERWRRAISAVASHQALGDAIGQVYVERYFPPTSKAMMEELVENLRTALRERIAGLDWMSEETKSYAFEKLEAFTPNIGYPNQWRDFSGVTIHADDLLGNVRQIRALSRQEALERLEEPTDKEEWFMSPQTVNAYYVAQFNSITFPAGILEAPFFDPAADPAVNYGAIGAVIGHEMGHGFDDQGSKSDARGVQRNWWTDEDRARFEARAARLAAQYSGYEPVPGTFIDGRFTLGENIGDLGGLEVAYHAYRLSLGGEEPPVVDGLTGDQRFFLSYAQVWRSKTRDETTVNRLKSDPHSPAEFRVNGIVRNVDAWYAAFDVTPEHALYLPPDERVSIW